MESDVDVCVAGCVELVTWRVDVVSDVESDVECDVECDVDGWAPGYVDSHVAGYVESGGVPRNLI